MSFESMLELSKRSWSKFQNSSAWAFIRRWTPGTALFILVLTVVAVVLWLAMRYLDTSAFSISRQSAAIAVVAIFLLFGLALMLAFFWLFRGINADANQLKGIINYCYAYIVFALSAVILPLVALPSLPMFYDVMTQSPIGIVIGCSIPPYIETVTGLRNQQPKDDNQLNARDQQKGGDQKSAPRIDDRFVPKELRCDANTDQWVVNIGGAILRRAPEEAAPLRVVQITGGLVVPLYAIVLSLMGAVVSMTRRVPEYQRRVSPGDADSISYDKAREALVFQIMQVTSAPLIALTVYYLVDPGSRSSTIVLSFAAGFSSETVLLVIRAMLEKLQPAPAGQTANAATISVAPTTLDFGSVTLNQTVKRPVVITNPGPVTLTVQSLSFSNSEFTAATQTPLNVPAHSTGTIDLEFRPTAVGMRQGQIQIVDNGNGSPRTVGLAGTGA